MVTAAPREPTGFDKKRAKVSVSPEDKAAENVRSGKKDIFFSL